MFLAYILVIYLNLWILFSLSFYGIAQIITILISVLFLLCISSKESKNFKIQKIDIILILPIILFFSNILSFISFDDFNYLARSVYIITPFILFLSRNSIGLTKAAKAFDLMLWLFIVSNLVSLLYLTKFSIAHSKFIPNVSWAFITSNNISYHVTLLSFLIIIFSYQVKRKFVFTLLICLFFTFIHLSKSHIVFLFISLISSWFIISKFYSKILLSVLSVILYFIYRFIDLKYLIDTLDLKPLSKIYYGFVEVPTLISINGIAEGMLIFISDVGDDTRSSIYLSAFNNLSQVGISGSDPSLYYSVFFGRDYHSTFFYIAYEYGALGIIYYLLFIIVIIASIVSVENKFIKFILVSSFIYFNLRSLFISVDLIWITLYWFFIFNLYYFGEKYAK